MSSNLNTSTRPILSEPNRFFWIGTEPSSFRISSFSKNRTETEMKKSITHIPSHKGLTSDATFYSEGDKLDQTPCLNGTPPMARVRTQNDCSYVIF